MNKKAIFQKQPTNVSIKLAVLLVIVFSTAALLTTHVVISRLRAVNQNLANQAMELEEDNRNLQGYIDHQGTDEGVKDVAKNELGMVDPNTVIYDFD